MTAKDLLLKILDYQYLWILPQNKNSKPAKLRLEQIESLLDAFGLTKKYVNPLVQIKYSITPLSEFPAKANLILSIILIAGSPTSRHIVSHKFTCVRKLNLSKPFI